MNKRYKQNTINVSCKIQWTEWTKTFSLFFLMIEHLEIMTIATIDECYKWKLQTSMDASYV